MANYNPTFSEEELQNEIWKSVVGYENCYEVSNLGRVRRKQGSHRSPVGKLLKPILRKKNNPDYLVVGLSQDGSQITHLVHRLVAAAFLGEPPQGYQVNHIDACKTNNRADNLEYVTPRYNTQHAVASGKIQTGANHYTRRLPELVKRGEQVPVSKLKEADVLEIRRLLRDGHSHTSIGRRFNVRRELITQINAGKVWRHVTG